MDNFITAKQAQIRASQSALQQYQSQIDEGQSLLDQLEKQRLDAQNQANHWNAKIRTWGVVSYYRKCRRRWFRKKCSNVPVYDWVNNPQAIANRDEYQNAANLAAKHRDEAAQKLAEIKAKLQPSVSAVQTVISRYQQELQTLLQQRSHLLTHP